MGGNLLTKGKRLERDKYLILENEIKTYLNNKITKYKYKIPRYYQDKPDFGDMDIIISNEFFINKKINEISFENILKNDLDLSICKFNSGILTTLYKGFQVDYFPIYKSKLEMCSNFMDYNIGNFIGKIARRFNLKYGMKGLYYIYRGDDNHYKRELFISNNIKDIFTLLDLDYKKWKQGFKNNIESYNWIIDSKYFSTFTYLTPKPGTKKRIKQRPEFENFTKWLNNNNINREFTFPSDNVKFDVIKDHFPQIDIEDFVKTSNELYVKKQNIKNKFNGNIIMNLIPNLKGKNLGRFMKYFENHINEYYGNFDNFILISSQEIINNEIIKFHNKNE